MRSTLTALLFLTACPAQRRLPAELPARTSYELDVQWAYYEVRGATAHQLRRALDDKGPLDNAGDRYDAVTDWHIVWQYPFSRSAAGCTTGEVTLEVSVTFEFPQWEPTHAPASLVRRWDRFVTALEDHEVGHAVIAGEAAEQIDAALESLPPKASCPALSEAANSLGQRILEETRVRQRDYDRRTRHGHTQGAVFP